MNKKEINEIKKNFCENSGFFTVNRVLTALVDPEKKISCKQVRLFSLIEEAEGEVIMETLKKILSGSLYKNLIEHEFPQEAYEEDGAQCILHSVLSDKLSDTASDTLLSQIVSNLQYDSAYAVISAHCTYSIRKKSKSDDFDGECTEEYNYIITAICPVNTGEIGLVVDPESNKVVKKVNNELIVSKLPSDGFLYPVFSDRQPDINAVLTYSKKPNEPNKTVAEDVLGCKSVLTPQGEKQALQQVLEDALGEDLDYALLTDINDKLTDVLERNKHDSARVSVDSIKLKGILEEVGVTDDKIEAFCATYKNSIGDTPLTVSNIIDNKTAIQLSDISLTVKKDGSAKVRTAIMSGRKCIVIDVDDPNIKINGVNTVLKG